MNRTLAIAALAGLGISLSCSPAGIQPIDDTKGVAIDDRLDISGRVCTSKPSEQVFPVKIMFIVDASGSMQFTDPSDSAVATNYNNNNASVKAYSFCMSSCRNKSLSAAQCSQVCRNPNNPGRMAAVKKVIDRFKNNPAVSFNIIRFNGRVTVNGGVNDAFTNDTTTINKALSSLLQAEITTDYQGALSSAYQALEKDMLKEDPVKRARTKYVIMFLSDGAPNPRCKAGCGNDKSTAGVPVDTWCDLPRSQWCDEITGSVCNDMTKNWYPSITEPCQAYNTDAEIQKKVQQIIDLGEQYAVGEIRMHTAFLFVDNLPSAILQLVGTTKATAEKLIKNMAKWGKGQYRSFNQGQKIDFLDINYSQLSRPFGITNFTVTNQSSIPNVTQLAVDSDGDGIDDKTEFDAKLDMSELKRDSDGDGYSDLVEYRLRNSGFDPGKATEPARKCQKSEQIDRDGDGLLDCEENVLGTKPTIADTDRDRIPDGVEYRFGTDPRKNDAKTDSDFDGKLASEEINIHADPTVSDKGVQADYKYIYDVKEQPERPDRKKCYDFKVRQVRLVTTKQTGQAGTVGYNDILVYFGEGPADDPNDYGSFKAACVRAQFVDKKYKLPADGKVTLKPSDFYKLPELLKRRKAAESDPDADPCVGAPLPGATPKAGSGSDAGTDSTP